MRKKFIYATILPLDKNNYQRFGIKNFIERDWDIEYWVLFEKLSSVFEEENLFYKKEKNFFTFKSILQVIKRIINLEKKNFYYLNIGLPWYVEVLMKIKGGKKIIIDTCNYPEVYNVVLKKFLLEKKKLKEFFSFSIKALDIIKKKIFSNFEVRPSYIFAAGSKSLYVSENYKNLNSKKIKIIKCHSLDYERYLEYKNSLPDKNLENSIVYIDQDHEGNYDLLLNNQKAIDAQLHWKSISNFLNNLSLKLKKKIIIAGHPKRNEKGKKFFDHKIIYNQTANLIKNSSLVIGHNSTAVSLVALFQKPYISITTDQLEKTVESFTIKKFSSELGTKLINIDHFNDYNSHDFLKYDKNIYNTYIENYAKTPDVKSNDFWSDFIDFFENEN